MALDWFLIRVVTDVIIVIVYLEEETSIGAKMSEKGAKSGISAENFEKVKINIFSPSKVATLRWNKFFENLDSGRSYGHFSGFRHLWSIFAHLLLGTLQQAPKGSKMTEKGPKLGFWLRILASQNPAALPAVQ